jgi:hypothetical protein
MLQTLREDFARIPELLALGAPEQPSRERVVPVAADADPGGQAPDAPVDALKSDIERREAEQLGLF